ncbi:MAG TPA: DinB family protein [Candidatus Dormibacteraeota bacterium]
MTTNAADPGARAALLDRIRQSWDTLQEAIRSLDDRQLTAPGPEGWSIKDHLAHLARWEQIVRDRLDGRDPGVALAIPDDQQQDVDAVNAHLRQRDAGLSTSEVLQTLTETHVRLVARIESLDAGELERWTENIEGNTHEHFAEHLDWIRTLI